MRMGVRRRVTTGIDFHRLSIPPQQKVAVLDFPAFGVFSAPPGVSSFHSLISYPGQVPVSEAHLPLESPLLNPSSQTGICWALCLPLLPGELSGPGGSLVVQPPEAHIWPCPLLGVPFSFTASGRKWAGGGKAALAGYLLFSSLKSQGWILHSPQGGGRDTQDSLQATRQLAGTKSLCF